MLRTNSLSFQDQDEVKHSWSTCIWNIRQHTVFLRVWITIVYTSIMTHFFTNTMASETSRKFLTNKKPLISNNILLVDIFPYVSLVWGCFNPSAESFISVTPQTLDQLDRCQQPAKRCFCFHWIVAFSTHSLFVLNKFSSKIRVYVTKKSHQNIMIYVPHTTEFVATRLENFQTCIAPYKAVVNYIWSNRISYTCKQNIIFCRSQVS